MKKKIGYDELIEHVEILQKSGYSKDEAINILMTFNFQEEVEKDILTVVNRPSKWYKNPIAWLKYILWNRKVRKKINVRS